MNMRWIGWGVVAVVMTGLTLILARSNQDEIPVPPPSLSTTIPLETPVPATKKPAQASVQSADVVPTKTSPEQNAGNREGVEGIDFAHLQSLSPEIAAPAGDASLSGIVIDPAGNPLADMAVEVSTNHSVNADSAGRFRLENLAAGTYELRARPQVSKGNPRIRHGLEVTVKAGQALDNLRLVYDRHSANSISGQVTDRKGVAIANAVVETKLGTHGIDSQTHSDSAGRYSLDIREGITCNLTVHHPNYSTQTRKEIQAGTTGVDVVLEGRGTVTGRVLDAHSGDAVTRFEIGTRQQVRGDGRTLFSAVAFATMEDDEGRFVLKDIDVGDIYVYARAPGYAPTRVALNGVRADVLHENVELRLHTGATFQGTVVDMAGTPIPDAEVRLQGQHDPWMRPPTNAYLPEWPKIRTDTEGRFAFASLDAGYDKVILTHLQHPETTLPVQLAQDETTTMELVMAGLATVEGTVYVNGVSMADQQVSVTSSETPRIFITHTDEGGHYSITDIPEGDVTVTAFVHQDNVGKPTKATAATRRGYTTVVDLETLLGTCSIFGAVLLDGTPLAHGFITARKTDAARDDFTQGDILAGAYQLTGLFPGTYTLSLGRYGPRDSKTGVPSVITLYSETCEVMSDEPLSLDFTLEDTLDSHTQ